MSGISNISKSTVLDVVFGIILAAIIWYNSWGNWKVGSWGWVIFCVSISSILTIDILISLRSGFRPSAKSEKKQIWEIIRAFLVVFGGLFALFAGSRLIMEVAYHWGKNSRMLIVIGMGISFIMWFIVSMRLISHITSRFDR